MIHLKNQVMQKREYKNIFENEQIHFYYVACHRIILSILKKYLPKKDGLKILDSGCGTGLLTKKLEQLGKVYAIDISDEAIRFAKKRGINVKKASVLKTGFSKNYFDAIVSIDVLSHKFVEDDQKAIEELYRILAPGGLLILKVPAFEILRGPHDEEVYTKKRYTKRDFKKLLANSKFKKLSISYIGSFLFPILFIKNIFYQQANESRSSISQVWSPLNRLLIFTFKLEAYLTKFISIPFGISLLVVLKKSNHS